MNDVPNNTPYGKSASRDNQGQLTDRRVLVLPAGTEIGLEIYASLKNQKNITLFGAGEDISTHARFVYGEYHVIPSIHTKHWLDRLLAVCRELRIGYIFPAHDDVIVALSEVRSKIPAVVVTSNKDACMTTRSKSATYRRLADILPVPHTYTSADSVDNYPVFVKPDRGQGSLNAKKIEDADQLALVLRDTSEGIICEYLPGEEYTIDCFSAETQGLLYAGARSRRRTRSGISINTVNEQLPEVWAMALAINTELKLRGAWFFQLKRSNRGTLTLLEVAPRIAGSMASHRVLGVNFPLLSILEQDGIEIKIATNPCEIELDRVLHNRYTHDIHFESLYIDLDDTLICNGNVNTDLIKLIFLCINQKKKVILITRHKGNLCQELQDHRLTGLFDNIIHITDGTPKSYYINHPNSIFIDDSFSERQEVTAVCKIPTFDISMTELLSQQAESMNKIIT